MPFKPETSFYLDVLRVAAVVLVFVDHAKRTAFTGGFLYRFGVYGQEAVAVFFVLSGFVIAHVTLHRPNQTLADYAIARLARLWSVVIPAIVLTVVLDCVGRQVAPSLYQQASLPAWTFDLDTVWRAASPAFFLNSVPPFKIEVGSNAPFWSLSYEACYYAAFALIVFLKGWKRIVALAAITWFVGPQIRLLAPIWFMGVVLRSRIGRKGPSTSAWLGWVGSIIGLALLLVVKYRFLFFINNTFGTWLPFGLTGGIIVEYYAVAILTCLNIYYFDRIAVTFQSAIRAVRPTILAVASRSFSVYLYQAPILFFIAAFSTEIQNQSARIAVFYGGGLAACILLAEVTERKKGNVVGWLKRSRRPLASPGQA